jgi:hypothetical protein
MTNEHSRNLGKLTHKQTTILALGLWRAVNTALAVYAAAVGTDAAIDLRKRLIKDAKDISTERIPLEDEATSVTALVASIDFSMD